MRTRIILPVVLLYVVVCLSRAQPLIYSESTSLITGIWTGGCTVTEVTSADPYDGITHLRVNYSTNAWWTGFGLNLDNWGSTNPIDFSGFNALQIAYRGLNGSTSLRIQLRDATGQSTAVQVGGQTQEYILVTLPLAMFQAGSDINLTAITELDISTDDITPVYSGTVYIDGIRLANVSYDGHTSLATWSRHARMQKGVNLANWLEAYWLIPFSAYPEVNRYNRNNLQQLVNMGFRSVRLPVTFENIASPNPPYTLPANHVALDLIDSTILWANEMGFNLIIDNHHGMPVTNENYIAEIARKRAIWQQITERYGHLDPEQFYFELYNEPTNAISNAQWHALADSVLQTIRQGAPQHTVIIGGTYWNSVDGLLNMQPFDDADIIYTFHSYEPFAFTHQGMSWTDPPYMPAVPFPQGNDVANLTNVISAADTYSGYYQVPVMLGEFGCSTSANPQSRCNYIEVIGSVTREYDMPWYYWDVISPSDAFGFLDANGNPIPCFAEALRLGEYNTCARLVTTTAHQGPGSLREQLACAFPGDTITFDASLAGDTIKVENLPLFIHQNVVLLNSSVNRVFIDNPEGLELINIAPGVIMRIQNLGLIARDESAIINNGIIYLENAEVLSSGLWPVRLESGEWHIVQEVYFR